MWLAQIHQKLLQHACVHACRSFDTLHC